MIFLKFFKFYSDDDGKDLVINPTILNALELFYTKFNTHLEIIIESFVLHAAIKMKHFVFRYLIPSYTQQRELVEIFKTKLIII